MNAAVQAHVASPPANGYEARWFSFDNETGDGDTPRLARNSPRVEHSSARRVACGDGTFVKVEVRQ